MPPAKVSSGPVSPLRSVEGRWIETEQIQRSGERMRIYQRCEVPAYGIRADGNSLIIRNYGDEHRWRIINHDHNTINIHNPAFETSVRQIVVLDEAHITYQWSNEANHLLERC